MSVSDIIKPRKEVLQDAIEGIIDLANLDDPKKRKIEARPDTFFDLTYPLSKDEDIRLASGDTIRVRTPGGGGYGDPWQRDPALVARDVARGYFTAADARSDYGVVLSAGDPPVPRPPRHRRAPPPGPSVSPAPALRRRPARSATLTKEDCMIRLARFLTLAAVVALIAGLPLPPAAHAQKAFKMGAIVPVSGPAAAFGLGAQRGMELAAEDVGTMTVGNDKYKVEVVTYDTVYDPGKTVAAMNRAVYNDGVKYGIIIGAGVHPPILPIIRETGFLDLAFAAAGRQITNSENPTVFRIMASSDQLYQTYLVPIVEKIGAKRVAFLGPNDELGKNDGKLVKAQVDTMKGKGVQFVAEEYYERGAKDFGPALLRLIAHKPDLIETDGSPTGSIALIAKQARELGFEGYFLNSTAVLEAKAISDIAGKAGDNIIALRIWAKPPTELYAQLAERHQKKYGEAAPGTLWEAYAATRWVADIVQKTGTFDTKKVAEALAQSTYPQHPFGAASWGGEKTYGAKRQIVLPIPAAILKGGKWEPFDVRAGKFD